MTIQKVDLEIFVANLAKTFQNNLNVELGDYAKELSERECQYTNDAAQVKYITISLNFAIAIKKHYRGLKKIDIECDDDDVYTVIIHNKKKHQTLIELRNKLPGLNNIIPKGLMKVCGYQGNSRESRHYKPEYARLNNEIYHRISKKANRYSELKQESKEKKLYEPFVDLFIETLSKKRRCATKLYSHFGLPESIIAVITPIGFHVYDFRVEDLGDNPSYRIEKRSESVIYIKFNNKTKFSLTLQSNATEIKEHLSLKYIVDYVNPEATYSILQGNF